MTDTELLELLLDGLDPFVYPDPDDPTRQWNSDFQTYHRGCALSTVTLFPDEARAIEKRMEQMRKDKAVDNAFDNLKEMT
jgi:hypothetical protein